MFKLISFSKSMAFCAVVALGQLSAVHAMDVDSKPSSKAPKKLVTFTAEDVVAHASKRSEHFDMDYLRSKDGKADITAFINKYNTDGVPLIRDLSVQVLEDYDKIRTALEDSYKTQIAREISYIRVQEGHFEFPLEKFNSLDDM